MPPEPSAEDEQNIRAMLQVLMADIETELLAVEDGFEYALDHRAGFSGSSPPRSASSVPDAGAVSAADVEQLLEAWTLEEQANLQAGWDDRSEPAADADADADLLKTTTRAAAADDPVFFLYSLFPKLSRETLVRRLAASNGQLETMLEELLNEEFLAAENSPYVGVHLSDADLDLETGLDAGVRNGSTGGASRKTRRKREKAAEKAAHVLNLTDVLHRKRPESPMLAKMMPTVAYNSAETNRWANLDSSSSYLAVLLHVEPGRVTSAYHRFDSSLPLAIEYLLNDLELERPFYDMADNERLLSELSLVLPDYPLASLIRLLSATNGDPSDAMDLKVKLEEIAREEGSLIMNGLFGFGGGGDDRRVVVLQEHSTLKPLRDAPTIIPAPGGWRKVATRLPSAGSSSSKSSGRDSSRSGGSSHASIPAGPFNAADYSAADCAFHANDFLTQRNDAYRTAAKSFQQGGNGMRGAALYFAEQGRELDRKKRLWEERAAFALVGERRYVPALRLLSRRAPS